MSEWNGRPGLALLNEKEEDRFTQFLRELLQAPEVLAAFLRGPCKLDVPDVAGVHAQTQVTVPDGRVDLVVSGPTLKAIFEAKVSSWLHDGQMPPYLEYVRRTAAPGIRKYLFVLGPGTSLPLLLSEARAQVAPLPPDVDLRAVSWQDVAKTFTPLAAQTENTRLRAHLEAFVDVISYHLGDGDEPFSSEELALLSSSMTGRAMRRVGTIYEKVVSRLKDEHQRGITCRNSSGQQWQGRTLRHGGRWWWFGIWPKVWAEIGHSPLVLQLPGATPTTAVPEGVTVVDRDKNGQALGQNRFVVPFRLTATDSPLSAGDRIADTIVRIVLEVPNSGGGGGTTPPAEDGPREDS